MPPHVAGLNGVTLQTAPSVCRDCVWWQSRAGREVDKQRWLERAEDERGAWGTLYFDDDGRLLELRGRQVWVAGFDPRSRGREPDLTHEADLRIALSHFPTVLDRLPEGSFEIVLAGHMHDGQICLPYPGGKLRLAHPTARYTHDTYRRGGTVMHVSPGLGTTFVPFRFFARPEATELVLRPAP